MPLQIGAARILELGAARTLSEENGSQADESDTQAEEGEHEGGEQAEDDVSSSSAPPRQHDVATLARVLAGGEVDEAAQALPRSGPTQLLEAGQHPALESLEDMQYYNFGARATAPGNQHVNAFALAVSASREFATLTAGKAQELEASIQGVDCAGITKEGFGRS